jgi:Ca2+/Na+ antiporter
VKAITFLLYLASNFVWILIVVGTAMAWVMPRTTQRNNIIMVTAGCLALILTVAVVVRGPDSDDGISSNCQTSRLGESCY